MALSLVTSSKSIDRSKLLSKWQNTIALIALFLLPIQRHFRLRFLEDPILTHQHSYNTLFLSFITPLLLLWSLLEVMRLITLKRVDFGKLFFAAVPILLTASCIGEHKILGLFHLYRIAELTLLLSMFWHWIESDGPEKVRNAFFKSALVMGVFESILIFLQFFSGKSVGLRFLGETRFDVKKLTSSFVLGVPHSLSEFFAFLPSRYLRAPGTAPHPNIMGGILAVYLLFVLTYFLSSGKESKEKGWKMPLVLSMLFSALLITFSRSALFGFGIGFVLIGSYMISQKIMHRRILAAFCAMLLAVSPFLLARGGVLFNSSKEVKETNQERVNMISLSLKMFKENPILGVGAGEYVTAVDRFHTDDASFPYKLEHHSGPLYQPVHNVPCLMLAEMGFFGLLTMVSLLFRYCVFKRPRTLFEWGALGALSAVLFIACCDHYLLSFPEGRVLSALCLSWFALEFHFARARVLEVPNPK